MSQISLWPHSTMTRMDNQAIAEQTQRMQARGIFAPDFDAPIPSPCVALCKRDRERGMCLSCFRTLDDIRVWNSADNGQRLQIWHDLLARAGLHQLVYPFGLTASPPGSATRADQAVDGLRGL